MAEVLDTNVMTLPQWAAYMGWKSPGMAYQARGEGRLVMAPDGQHVLAEESRARYLGTAAPSHTGVAKRHARQRTARQEPTSAEGEHTQHEEPDRAGKAYQNARAVRERYLSLEAKRAYEVAIGKLADRAEAAHIAALAMTEIRARLETVAVTLAPMLAAASDESAITAMLRDEFEQAQRAMAMHFKTLQQEQPV